MRADRKRIELIYRQETPEAPRPLFRVWIPTAEKYAHKCSGGICMALLPNGIPIRLACFDDSSLLRATEDRCALVERATGMPNRKGTEIYEGDIVEFDYWDRREVGFVTYKPEFATFHVALSGGDSVKLFARDPVVLGNIHENPELVEVGE
jgi:hypothetical protein